MTAKEGDTVIRALTDDGSFRVLTARTTDLCRTAIARQAVRGVTARHFGDLLTGTVLVRETMAPQLRVQGIVRGAGGGCTLVGDSFPDGGTRGLVSARTKHPIELGGDAVLQFLRTMPNGAVHRGVVSVPDEGGVSAALMAYMQESEQILTVMNACTLFADDGAVRAAGGYVVQLLPGADRDVVTVMTERLALDFSDIERFVGARGGFDPDALLEEILYRIPFARVETRKVGFHCPCSQASVLAGLATLDRSEIQSFIDDGELLDIACEYCTSQYQVAPDQLRGLVSES